MSVEELEKSYRQATGGIKLSHYQIIWLLAQGYRTEEVARLTGYSRSWIYELVRGYNRLGVEALGDKLVKNEGIVAMALGGIASLWGSKIKELAVKSPPESVFEVRPLTVYIDV